MAYRSLFLILALFSAFLNHSCYSETDTLLQGQHLKDWDYLISSNKVFSLKFFGFHTTMSPYLGVFYSDNYQKIRYACDKAVWVANRNNPIPDMYGNLMIDVYGKLSILCNGGVVVVDLFSPTPLVARNASATLLDSGNLVLHELNPDGSVKRVLWQSFDYPTDTLLPGMKLGINLKTGHRWSLTSWRSDQLPADGSFTLTGDLNGTDQMVILRRGNIHWKSGLWQNGQFTNTDLQSSGPDVHLDYVSNKNEQSFTYFTKTYDSNPALIMNQDGWLKGSSPNLGLKPFTFYTNSYGSNLPLILYQDDQLKGSNLNLNIQCHSINDPPGCVEDELEKLNCRKDYYIVPKSDYPIYVDDEYIYDESDNLTLYDCKRICWSSCSCKAYTYATKNGAGCKTYGIWINYNEDGRYQKCTECYTFNYHEAFAEKWEEAEEKKNRKIRLVVIIGLVIIIVPLALLISSYWVYKKRDVIKDLFLNKFGKAKKIKKLLLHELRRFYDYIRINKNMNTEVHYFTFQSISSATNNFSNMNKLGEGGFGAVYKGKLVDGQEVAVKRLSRSSGQGVKEFKNEIELIAKLQHTNLVRLIGCCVEKQEKILVYEYMPNNSLDFLLFDPKKKGLLDWNRRFVIMDGIAQGLLYLHRFSRLRVIHRDLKASNILLDDYMKPKISDFGMAKLFGINESEANTSRVVGTRGYMSPEYMMEGTVSTKIDVYSFGVMLLEIVSSKMNQGSYDAEHPLNLPGFAWELWNEGRGLELMDPVLEDSCTPKEVMTCIHVGLLCVQDNATDRPTMSEVISMLTNEHMHLPEPKRPAFFIERHDAEAGREYNLGNGSTNNG